MPAAFVHGRHPYDDIPAKGFLAISAAVFAYVSVSSFVCSPIAFTKDCMNSVPLGVLWPPGSSLALAQFDLGEVL
jgi:hypothetical protein